MRTAAGEVYVSTPRTPDAYVDAAQRLANDPDRLSRLQISLQSAVEQNFFNYYQHVQQLKVAYETMWRRHPEGAPYTAFSVHDDQVIQE